MNIPTPPSDFAQQVPEKSEIERIQERIANFKIGLSPQSAQIVNGLLESHLKTGQVKPNELEALILVRDDVVAGVEEYNTQVKSSQTRLQVLLEEEQVAKQLEIARRIEGEKTKTADERQLRKATQDRLKLMEEALAKAGLSIDLDGDGVIGLPSGESTTPLTETEQQRVDQIIADTPAPKPASKPKTKAWDMIRALNPVTEESLEDVNEKSEDTLESMLSNEDTLESLEDSEPVIESTLSVDDDFNAQVDEAKKSFAEFIEPKDEEEPEEEYLANISSGVSSEDQMEMDLIDEEQFNDSFVVDEEDDKSSPSFAPVITGGNAPNIQAKIEEPQSINASIPSFDTEEDLLANAQAKIDAVEEEVEEEFEEIVIPNASELQGLTKAKIQEQADLLGFSTVVQSQTKQEMIDTFVLESEAYIKELTEDSGFISANELTDGEDDGNDNRDGGYF